MRQHPSQIIKQSNGMLALWCGVTQALVLTDATIDDITAYRVAQYTAQAHSLVKMEVEMLEEGKPMYHTATLSWAEALELTRELYGPEAVETLVLGLKKEDPPNG